MFTEASIYSALWTIRVSAFSTEDSFASFFTFVKYSVKNTRGFRQPKIRTKSHECLILLWLCAIDNFLWEAPSWSWNVTNQISLYKWSIQKCDCYKCKVALKLRRHYFAGTTVKFEQKSFKNKCLNQKKDAHRSSDMCWCSSSLYHCS